MVIKYKLEEQCWPDATVVCRRDDIKWP